MSYNERGGIPTDAYMSRRGGSAISPHLKQAAWRTQHTEQRMEERMIHGLRTIKYSVSDIERAKAWYAAVLGKAPYFDEPFYVGFTVGGFELGLDPNPGEDTPGVGGVVAYWGVDEIDAELQRLVELGAAVRDPAQDVGDDIRLAVVADPFGNSFGIIENPHFTIADVR
jgi:predicted enzyme related to lactoylglutathione lyase